MNLSFQTTILEDIMVFNLRREEEKKYHPCMGDHLSIKKLLNNSIEVDTPFLEQETSKATIVRIALVTSLAWGYGKIQGQLATSK